MKLKALKTMTNRLPLSIPFEGFYNSTYDSMVDRWFEYESYNLADDGASDNQVDEWNESAYKGINYRAVYIDIAKHYVADLCEYIVTNGGIDLKLAFDELVSPREYNFTTDQIFATIGESEVSAMYAQTDGKILRETIKARHTSRSGFISFYPNDLDEWPKNPLEWDNVQLHTLLQAYLIKFLDCDMQGDLDEKLSAYNVMESYIGNGYLDCTIWESASEEFKAFDEKLRRGLDESRIRRENNIPPDQTLTEEECAALGIEF